MGKSGRTKKTNPKEILSFDIWINQRLSSLEIIENETTTDTLLRVARLWMQPESKQFFAFAQRLCFGSKRMTYRLAFSNSLLVEVLSAMDKGKLELAKYWLMTFGLLMEQELKTLIEIIHLLENAKVQTSDHMKVCEIVRKKAPYLVLCFYFCKNRASVSEWLLKISQTLFVNDVINSDVAFTKCWITVVNKSTGVKSHLYFNRTSKLKTLMMLLHEMVPRSYRIIHRGRQIFLSDGGDNLRLHEMGVQDHDVIILIDTTAQRTTQMLAIEDSKPNNTTGCSTVSARKSLPRSNRKSCRKSCSGYTIVVPDRVRHSTLLTRVFEEAEPMFAERRKCLNELAIKKCNPKPRLPKAKTNTGGSPSNHNISELIGGKPGKIFFPVTVGEPNFLYRSSKIKSRVSSRCLAVDLHGCTKNEAIAKLEQYLPEWIEKAMKNHPFTFDVDIVCGGGSQILSEEVEKWIKAKATVANRFY
ncbi:hypothetical protein ACHAWO_003946 [Cyclotella atomus]|uniref:Smr domain-containing protein n=1 Tax=Cyclotella atomus TaxID=382360 RepID=A0ABD3MUC9_9STRA